MHRGDFSFSVIAAIVIELVVIIDDVVHFVVGTERLVVESRNSVRGSGKTIIESRKSIVGSGKVVLEFRI